MMAMIFMLSVEDGCGRGASVEEWKVFYAIPMWIREESDDTIPWARCRRVRHETDS